MRTIQVIASSLILTGLGLALAGSGCGGSDDPCIQACEDTNDCGNDSDCEAECARYDTITNCKQAFDDLWACYNDNDVCSIEVISTCSDQISATFTCTIEFCNENPDDPSCATQQ